VKQEAKLVFYASGPVKKYDRTSLRVQDTKVIPSEECVAKHKLVVMDMWTNKLKRCHKKSLQCFDTVG